MVLRKLSSTAPEEAVAPLTMPASADWVSGRAAGSRPMAGDAHAHGLVLVDDLNVCDGLAVDRGALVVPVGEVAELAGAIEVGNRLAVGVDDLLLGAPVQAMRGELVSLYDVDTRCLVFVSGGIIHLLQVYLRP